jgi:hypothetical protein
MRPVTLSELRDQALDRLIGDIEGRLKVVMQPRRLCDPDVTITPLDWARLAAAVVRLYRERRDRENE